MLLRQLDVFRQQRFGAVQKIFESEDPKFAKAVCCFNVRIPQMFV